jgi:hypothetical protein
MGLLTDQYFCDGYIKMETNNLEWLRQNQSKIRADAYSGLIDYIVVSDHADASKVGKRVILPFTFGAGP